MKNMIKSFIFFECNKLLYKNRVGRVLGARGSFSWSASEYIYSYYMSMHAEFTEPATQHGDSDDTHIG